MIQPKFKIGNTIYHIIIYAIPTLIISRTVICVHCENDVISYDCENAYARNLYESPLMFKSEKQARMFLKYNNL